MQIPLYVFNGKANSIMRNALINFKRGGDGGVEPKGFVGSAADNFFNLALAFNNSGEHGGKIRLFCILFWNKRLMRLIFASLKITGGGIKHANY